SISFGMGARRTCAHGLLGAVWVGVFMCLAVAAHAEVTRPPGTGTGPVVARVHLRGGPGCQIRSSGHAFPAVPGLPLLKEDEMIVPVGEFLVVALGNGHLVRI